MSLIQSMDDITDKLPSGFEVGRLGIRHSRRFWFSTLALTEGGTPDRLTEYHLDRVLLDCLGVGLHQAIQYLLSNTPSFELFEQWVVDIAGEPDPDQVMRFNMEYEHLSPCAEYSYRAEKNPDNAILTHSDMQFWHENGYIRISDLIDPALIMNACGAVWQAAGASPADNASWYLGSRSGIMIGLIQHPALEAIRRSPMIHRVFSELWDTGHLWASADRCSFHPPQTSIHAFQGPDLHWDVDVNHTVSLFTQGLVYLTDTPAEQGALTLVPGFHHRFQDWINDRGLNPQIDLEELHAQGSIPIAGKAGDLIIWHHWLPHGSRPNLGNLPRVVQYLNMYPMHLDYGDKAAMQQGQ